MKKFEFLKVFFSPFKPIRPKLYIGRTAVGVPVFLPRRWKKVKGGYTACPKEIGFDFKGLYYKTKWDETDFRIEFNPVWSFVFFGYQIAIIWVAPCNEHFWESWLTYYLSTDKERTVKERIKQAREINPNIWTTIKSHEDKTEEINYWDKILKNKYL